MASSSFRWQQEVFRNAEIAGFWDGLFTSLEKPDSLLWCV